MRAKIIETVVVAIVALAVIAPGASAHSLTLNQGKTAIKHWARDVAAELNSSAADNERAEHQETGELSLELGNRPSVQLDAVRLSRCVRHRGAVGCVVDLVETRTGIECVTIAVALPTSPIRVTKTERFQCAQGEG
jgi:hypothetical protein